MPDVEPCPLQWNRLSGCQERMVQNLLAITLGKGNKIESLTKFDHLETNKAGPNLTPFEATNLKRLKISHLDRRGNPCSI